MKRLLCLLLVSTNSYAMELVINGITYHIDEYKITQNGQRIEIKHPALKKHICKPAASKTAPAVGREVRYKKYSPQIKLSPFDRLLKELQPKERKPAAYQ